MKKIAILALIVLIVFFVGCEYGIPTGNVVYNPETDEVSVELDIQPDEDPIPEEEPVIEEEPTSEAKFRDVRLIRRGVRHTIEGTAYDSISEEGIVGLSFAVYCSGEEVFSDVTDDEGAFQIPTLSGCKAGDDVWIELEYDEETYESKHMTIPRLIFGGGGSSGGSSRSTASTTPTPTNGVPEFSTITLALAVIGGCLGLAFLRKD